MKCISCGKEIPEQSIFCLYCGKKQEKSPAEKDPRFTPISLNVFRFDSIGPKEIQRGSFFSVDKIGRGFCFSLMLLNYNNKKVISDGKLIIVMYSSSIGLTPPILEAKVEVAQNYARGKNALFSKSIELTEADFDENYNYEYIQMTPLVFVDTRPFGVEDVNLHAWFVTDEGKCLYDNIKTGLWDR